MIAVGVVCAGCTEAVALMCNSVLRPTTYRPILLLPFLFLMMVAGKKMGYVGHHDTDGKFAVENEGVTPDIVLDNDPTLMVKGQDPQLEKALEVIKQMLKDEKYPVPALPTTFPKR